MNDHFLKLFHYDYWANELVNSFLYDHKINDGEISKLASHIQNAKFIWYSRVSGLKQYDYKVWEVYSLNDLPHQSKESTRLWTTFLHNSSEENLAGKITYTNSQGKEFTTKCSDIIVHVINHGTYHRAQIAKLLRQQNINPPNTDYIVYTRQ